MATLSKDLLIPTEVVVRIVTAHDIAFQKENVPNNKGFVLFRLLDCFFAAQTGHPQIKLSVEARRSRDGSEWVRISFLRNLEYIYVRRLVVWACTTWLIDWLSLRAVGKRQITSVERRGEGGRGVHIRHVRLMCLLRVTRGGEHEMNGVEWLGLQVRATVLNQATFV